MRLLVILASLVSLSGLSAVPAPAPAAANRPLEGVRINIDPGHNGENRSHTKEINRQVDAGPIRKACDTTGTASNSGVTESSYNFAVATRLRDELKKRGAIVTMTRQNDTGWGPCINRRAALGNKAQLAISIHADGSGSKNRGFHVIKPTSQRGYTDDIAADSARLATLVRNSMDKSGIPRSNYLGTNGIDSRKDLGGLNLSNVPKVFIESGNMRNSADAKALAKPKMRQRIAVLLADALEDYAAEMDS